MINISVVIVTKNWEKTIHKALDSLILFNEVIVVIDNSSLDVYWLKKIINNYTNTKILEINFENFSQIKNYWIKLASNDYILILDDDEFLSKWFIDYLSNNTQFLKNSWYNIFFHEYMWWQYNKYATWWSYHLRLIKKWIIYQWDVHEYFQIDNKDIVYLSKEACIFHYSHTSIEKTINKFNLYTNMEESRFKNLFILYFLLITLPIYQFLIKYFIKLWFLEWWNGFIVSVYRWIYEFIKYAKIIERNMKKTNL